MAELAAATELLELEAVTAEIGAVWGPNATLLCVEELLVLFDILGMFFIAVVFIGLDTKFDNDLMGDCSSNTASEEA